MAYFKTSYDASSTTLSIDDEQVARALGVLADKTPAALKVAINTTARQTRKVMLQEVKERYDLNAAGKRMIEDLRQRQKATNRRQAAILAIMKNDPGAFRADLGYFRTSPTKPYMGPSVRNAPPFFQAHVLKGSPMIDLGGTSSKSKGFLVKFQSGHIGMVQRQLGVPADKDDAQPFWLCHAPYCVGDAGTDSGADAAGQHRTARSAVDCQCEAKGRDLIWRRKSLDIPARCASRP